MTCPVCAGRTTVTYTLSDCDLVARKRMCSDCGHVFYTTEIEQKDSRYDFTRLQREKTERFKKAGERNGSNK